MRAWVGVERVDQALEHGEGGGSRRPSLVVVELGQPLGQPGVALLADATELAAAMGGDLHGGDPAVVGIGRALDPLLGLEGGDDAGDRRRPHVLEGGQLAEGERAAVLDGGQRGLLRRRDAREGLLAQAAGQAEDGQARAGDGLGLRSGFVSSRP